MPQSIQNFFSEEERQELLYAIHEAELRTSGEIRIHLDNHCKAETPELRAVQVFEQLGMHRTEHRNGVLFYIAVKDKRFAVIGDAGIHAVVGDDFWSEIGIVLAEAFRQGMYLDGLLKGIETCAEVLRSSFPYESDDVDELSDDLSFGSE
jgi:uncharacterized membrane protein